MYCAGQFPFVDGGGGVILPSSLHLLPTAVKESCLEEEGPFFLGKHFDESLVINYGLV